MEPITSPQDQKRDQEIIERLKVLGSYKIEYPPELFAKRRAAFLVQAEQKSKEGIQRRKQLLEHLEDFGSVQAPYPPELLAARRATFIAQVDQLTQVKEEITPKDHELIRLLKKIKLFDLDYAPKEFAARRAAFLRQMAWASEISLLDALRSSIEDLFRTKLRIPVLPSLDVMRTSLVIATLLVAAFIGSLLFRNPQPLLNPPPASQSQVGQPAQPQATSTAQLATVICRPGFKPPLCLAREFDRSQDLTYAGNGSARPAVAKDTYPGNDGIHNASNANDGLYGPGASWTSDSAYSWIKIDLGKETTINTVTFGKDRLGNFTGGDPGQFVIAVALHDDVYADGVSTNDFVEYTQVFNSKDSGFNGIVAGPETIRAQFAPVQARYVKITFQNAKTTVDEVEVFMARPADLTAPPTRKPKDNGLGNGPVVVLTAVPTNTLLPPDTPTPVPTNTLAPTNTFIPPTDTPLPTDTSTPKPTRTPVPTNTATPVPTDTTAPTDTAVPPPTDTPVPLPTDTPVPPPPPTDTPMPVIVPTDIATLVQGP